MQLGEGLYLLPGQEGFAWQSAGAGGDGRTLLCRCQELAARHGRSIKGPSNSWLEDVGVAGEEAGVETTPHTRGISTPSFLTPARPALAW